MAQGAATLARPSTVLFDWDNTLVDTWAVIHTALNTTLAAMGEPTWTLAETRARVRRSAREAFPAWFGGRAEEASRIFYEAFEAEHLAQLRPLPGAAELIDGLAAAGYDLAVISNKQGYLLRREADHLGWTGRFRALVGAGDAAADKPDPAAVTLALGGEDSPRAAGPSVWLVGDTDIDMDCAGRAGCVPVLLRAEPPGAGEFADSPPAVHVGGCAELAELLLTSSLKFHI
jgi:phosphoglycolate phosphatase